MTNTPGKVPVEGLRVDYGSRADALRLPVCRDRAGLRDRDRPVTAVRNGFEDRVRPIADLNRELQDRSPRQRRSDRTGSATSTIDPDRQPATARSARRGPRHRRRPGRATPRRTERAPATRLPAKAQAQRRGRQANPDLGDQRRAQPRPHAWRRRAAPAPDATAPTHSRKLVSLPSRVTVEQARRLEPIGAGAGADVGREQFFGNRQRRAPRRRCEDGAGTGRRSRRRGRTNGRRRTTRTSRCLRRSAVPRAPGRGPRRGTSRRALIEHRAGIRQLIPRAMVVAMADPDVEVAVDPGAGEDRRQRPRRARRRFGHRDGLDVARHPSSAW